MDDYTLQQELELLAGNAWNHTSSNDDQNPPEPISKTASRWSTLFKMSADEAVDGIMEHRTDLTRIRVSNEHWSTLRSEKEAEGYDREAYEYELNIQQKKAILPFDLPTAEDTNITYLVELSGSLDRPQKVQAAAGLDREPKIVFGSNTEDERPVALACIDATAKHKILIWASEQSGGFEPTILVNPQSLRGR